MEHRFRHSVAMCKCILYAKTISRLCKYAFFSSSGRQTNIWTEKTDAPIASCGEWRAMRCRPNTLETLDRAIKTWNANCFFALRHDGRRCWSQCPVDNFRIYANGALTVEMMNYKMFHIHRNAILKWQRYHRNMGNYAKLSRMRARDCRQYTKFKLQFPMQTKMLKHSSWNLQFSFTCFRFATQNPI